ncbi:MAG TPA: multiheme c-type cytochrome, partial [Planctomycetia bacterium]|nr:multiheme c-type cytochrome [Planctomycetia bacterium]
MSAALACALLVGVVFLSPSGADSAHPARPSDIVASTAAAPAFLVEGVGSCAGASCHGANAPLPDFRSAYSFWKSAGDPHAAASQALFKPVSLQMAAILKRSGALAADETPATAKLCLQCHGSPASGPSGHLWTASEGISCEQCHGAASGYLVPHAQPDWKTVPAAAKTALGLRDTKSLAGRARTCIACHVGVPGQEVGHELIAAGHPILRFDFRTYLARYPGKHWDVTKDKRSADRAEKKEMPFELEALLEGRRALGRAAVKLVAAHAKSPSLAWPEFADQDCLSCHKNLSTRLGGRSAPGALGRANWGDWYFPESTHGSPASKSALPPSLAAMTTELRRARPDRSAVAAAAAALDAELARLPELDPLAHSGYDDALR